MANRLQDKVVLITGASRGVGEACALACAREGAHLALAAKTVDPNHTKGVVVNERTPWLKPTTVARWPWISTVSPSSTLPAPPSRSRSFASQITPPSVHRPFVEP